MKASDVGSGVASVEIYDNGNPLGAASLSNGSWVVTANSLGEGKNVITAVATDKAGNTSTSPLSVTDKVDHNGVPTLGAITETKNAAGTKGTFKFDVSNLIGTGVAQSAGPNIDHVSYWIDAHSGTTADPTSVPGAASNAGSLNLGNVGHAQESITVNNISSNVGEYLHVQAVDTLGHTSVIGNKLV